MATTLELCNSRVSRITISGDTIVVHFSVAYLYKTAAKSHASLWGQEAHMQFHQASYQGDIAGLPCSIADGFLEAGGMRYELIPLPLHRKVAVRLYLDWEFSDSCLDVHAQGVDIELLGQALLMDPKV